MIVSERDSPPNGDGSSRPSVRSKTTRGELGILAALIVVALSNLIPILRCGLPLSGATGLYAEDQLQYFAWVREASHHVLIGNRFDLAPGARTYLHPALALSGFLHAITGLPIPLAYLIWAPVAVAVVFLGYAGYVRRLLPRAETQMVAIVLALFTVSPLYSILRPTGWLSPLAVRTAADLSREVWLAGNLLPYPITAIGIGLMPLVMLAFESWRKDRRARTLWATSAGALFVSWIHPWQGATLALVVVGVEGRHFLRSHKLPPSGILAVLAAFALPALYFLLLTKLDPVWQVYHRQAGWEGKEWLPLALAIGPLALPAALGYRLPAQNWQEEALRWWPAAALIVYLLPIGTYPFHAFDGTTLPLAVLGAAGVASLRLRLSRAVVASAVLLLTVPAWLGSVAELGMKARSGEHGYFIRADERRALRALESDPRKGGVLAPVSPGALIPFATGREVYVGHDAWSPQFQERAQLAEALFSGRLDTPAARALVRSTHARFLFADCRHSRDLSATLGPLLDYATNYGCATIYELVEEPDMAAAAGAPDE